MSIPRESFAEKNKQIEINTRSQIEENRYSNVTEESLDQSQTMEGFSYRLNSLNDSALVEAPVESIQAAKEKVRESYSHAGNKVKAVKEKAEYEPKHVSLSKPFAVDEGYDSKEMTAIKEAINRYHNAKNSENPDERAFAKEVLDSVIKACDKYTKWKFSIFKFGEAAERLKEVKMVREEALREKKELIKERIKDAKGRTYEQREKDAKERLQKISDGQRLERYYAKDLTNFYENAAESLKGEERKILKAKIDFLRDEYKGMKYDVAQKLVMKITLEGRQVNKNNLNVIDSYVKNELGSEWMDKVYDRRYEKERKREEKQRAKEPKTLFDQYIKDYNPLSRFFYKYIFSTPIKNQIMKDKILAIYSMQKQKEKDEEERKKREQSKPKKTVTWDNLEEGDDTSGMFI